jgi:hypothetical protein
MKEKIVRLLTQLMEQWSMLSEQFVGVLVRLNALENERKEREEIKEVIEEWHTNALTLRISTERDFSHALKSVKQGEKVAREEWGGNQYCILLWSDTICVVKDNRPDVWKPTAEDLMAEDWLVCE